MSSNHDIRHAGGGSDFATSYGNMGKGANNAIGGMKRKNKHRLKMVRQTEDTQNNSDNRIKNV